MSRKLAVALKPGDVIRYRNGLTIPVERVTIRNGFSGPFAVVVDFTHRDGTAGREIYAAAARLEVAR